MATATYIPNVFETGNLVFTPSIVRAIESGFSPVDAFNNHRTLTNTADCPEDHALNVESASDGGRVFTAHDTEVGRIWIITEWDRSVTTVLFPSDY